MNSCAPAPDESNRIDWYNRCMWLDGCDLVTEWKQAEEEGRDLTSVADEFRKLIDAKGPAGAWQLKLGGERDLNWLACAAKLMERVQRLPLRTDFLHVEPSDLPNIRLERPPCPLLPPWNGEQAQWLEKLHGGLLGRMCGCTLGKPVETWTRADIRLSAELTGNYPLQDYWRFYSAAEAGQIEQAAPLKRFRHPGNRCFRENLDGMDQDDDINYTTMGFLILKRMGSNFTPLDVAQFWCGYLPILHTCTAERVAYRNFVDAVTPPHSATLRNPYREWIGAQIRADYFGYANPGNPERAAEWAWRDACVSHIKNGIYGEMWAAAMLAAAYVESDMSVVIRAGLAQVPARSRFTRDINKILEAHSAGVSWENVVEGIHEQWDETDQHDWCHVISNAQVVAAALLYGENDFETTISRAVMAGFDTDCNGATAGSVWGVVHGRSALPDKWTLPLRDNVRTGVTDFHQIKISELACQMVDVAVKNQPSH